ncbi:MAG: hypothetical protein KDD58_14420, partial [Bdellovibrionales bacterium]|nr:hypothetical protein [Bdellovibrionales bacterium]
YSKDSLSSESILKMGFQTIAAELEKLENNIVYCAGPLASTIVPLLKSTNTKKQFRIKDEEYCSLCSLILEDQNG